MSMNLLWTILDFRGIRILLEKSYRRVQEFLSTVTNEALIKHEINSPMEHG